MATIIRALWGIIEICKALLFSVNKRISGGPDATGDAILHETTTPNFIYSLASAALNLLDQIEYSSSLHPYGGGSGGGDRPYEEKIILCRCFVLTHFEHQLFIDRILEQWVLNSYIWENKKLPPNDGVKDKGVANSPFVPKKSHLLYIVPYCMEVGDVSLL